MISNFFSKVASNKERPASPNSSIIIENRPSQEDYIPLSPSFNARHSNSEGLPDRDEIE